MAVLCSPIEEMWWEKSRKLTTCCASPELPGGMAFPRSTGVGEREKPKYSQGSVSNFFSRRDGIDQKITYTHPCVLPFISSNQIVLM